MFRNAFQSGLLSVLYSCGSSPLELWGMEVKNGFIRRVTDEEVKTLALEIAGTNVATTYIYTPKNPKTVLAISLPFLVMIIKNLKKYFTFEITVLDNKSMHRRFRISNFQSTTKVRPFCTTMPIGLEGGWNEIRFNLADFTRRAYGSNYVETTRMQVHANCRIRRIYFADRLYAADDLPEDYKLLFPARRESRSRESLQQEKRKSQQRISVGAVPADEAPPFRGDSEKLEQDERVRKTTPVPSVDVSRTIVAPDGASRVQIELEPARSEDEASLDQEMELDEAIAEEREEPEGTVEETAPSRPEEPDEPLKTEPEDVPGEEEDETPEAEEQPETRDEDEQGEEEASELQA